MKSKSNQNGEFEIKSNIPIPTGRGIYKEDPFKKAVAALEVGQCFDVPLDYVSYTRSKAHFIANNLGRKVVVRAVGLNLLRVWRVK